MKNKKADLDDMDVIFDPTPLTKEEQHLISEYIRQDKARQRAKKLTTKTKLKLAA